MKNIIFFEAVQRSPTGGSKIIYQYSSYINSLKNFTSSIIYLKKKRSAKWVESIKKKLYFKKNSFSGWRFDQLKIKKNYKFKWFNQKVVTKNNLIFDKKKDFVILPEIFAHFANDFLIKEKIPYAIFVQNGYAIFSTNDFKKLNSSYRNAKYIMTYSKDIEKCVSLAFPEIKNKIFKVKYSIDFKKINYKKKKENLITYMPRKLAKHSELVICFLKNTLPSNWKIKKIHNLKEKQVYKLLEKSKIFLAFSDLEGLPLPPVEAALAGNKVIGYTGEGGKEYWKKPIFTEIKTSEIKNFCNAILVNLNIKNFLKKTNNQRKLLAKQFSVEVEKKFINKFLKSIS